jgi:polyhydroxyalkanoate synthesis regulator protein
MSTHNKKTSVTEKDSSKSNEILIKRYKFRFVYLTTKSVSWTIHPHVTGLVNHEIEIMLRDITVT